MTGEFSCHRFSFALCRVRPEMAHPRGSLAPSTSEEFSSDPRLRFGFALAVPLLLKTEN